MAARGIILLISILFFINRGMSLIKCPLEKQKFTNIPTFAINEVEKFITIQKIVVTEFEEPYENETACYFEIKNLFTEEADSKEPRLRAYAFGCKKPTNIVINGTDKPRKEIISYVQIQGCSMDIESLDLLANHTSVTVLNVVVGGSLTTWEDGSNCKAFDGIGTMLLASANLDMDDFFSCKTHLSFLAEVVMSNLSLTALPTNISRYLPTLQSLDLSINNFTVPPLFPWDNDTRILPRNLSRTPFLHNQYTFRYTIDLPTNEYRREFRLDYNIHLNLTGYTFQGHLHLLSLTGCRLVHLPDDVFLYVRGIQYLSLARNNLQDIPRGLFSNLNTVRQLEMEGNNLTVLHGYEFQGLKSLLRLNLAKNGLTSLGDGLFSHLHKLQQLSLQYNQLKHVNNHAFSTLLTKLKVVNLEHNPLVHIPEGLFLLRSLGDIKLRGHNITDVNFTRLDIDIDKDQLKYAVAKSVSTGTPDLDKPANGPKKVDLSDGPIARLSYSPVDKYSPFKIMILLKHFNFILDNNPIMCDCHILNIIHYVKEIKKNGTIVIQNSGITLYGDEYAFDNWKCSFPSEIKGRTLFSILDRDTYCPYESKSCPENCTCYKRSEVGSIIVDCRNSSLTEVPKTLPKGNIEFWLQDNAIKRFALDDHLSKQVVELYLQRNGLETIKPHCLSQMTNLKVMYIQDNLLASIPKEITTMGIRSMKLGGNPLQCDCNSVWMKRWLVTNRAIVQDPFDVKCVNFVEETGKNILEVPDEDFICEKVPLYKIAVPTAVPTATALLLLIAALLLFIFWADFKVFLYIHTGFHPFDKADPIGTMQYDAFVVYPMTLIDWVHEHIVNPLQENNNYVLYDVAKDFKFGHSLQDNVQHGVQFSRRMVLILSEETLTDSLMQLALEAGLEKSRDDKANFIIPVLYSADTGDFDNELLKKYFKAKKYVTVSSHHFLKRLVYYLPTIPLSEGKAKSSSERVNIAFEDTHIDIIDSANSAKLSDINTTELGDPRPLPQPDVVEGLSEASNVFVWYADSDFHFMMDRIVHPFEAEGHNFILSDKTFIPGAAIQENILHAVEDSDRTVIILSQDTVIDEWTLYVFRFASERQMVDRGFLVGIVVREGMRNVQCDEEIVKHLRSYQPLSEKDGKFHEKLQTFLSVSPNKRTNAVPLERLVNGDINLNLEDEVKL